MLLTTTKLNALLDKTLNPSLALVAPDYSGNVQLVYSGTNNQYTVTGITANYPPVCNLQIASDRLMSQTEIETQTQAVGLGTNVAADLFGTENPVGLSVRINGQPFQVIGVSQAVGGFGRNSADEQAFVPLGVAQGLLFNAPRYRGQYTVSNINLEVASQDQVDAAQQQIDVTLRLHHNLNASAADDFNIFNQVSLRQTAPDIAQTLTVFLGAIGAISLLVGGIGIMNIMLVSVTERTREIGLRKAIGAYDDDILLQSLVEALTLCFLGGLMGMGLTYSLTALLLPRPPPQYSHHPVRQRTQPGERGRQYCSGPEQPAGEGVTS